jgi:hypothetical protein
MLRHFECSLSVGGSLLRGQSDHLLHLIETIKPDATYFTGLVLIS